MTRVDLTKAQCAELANYLRGVLNNGMGAGSFDKIEMLVLARRGAGGTAPRGLYAPVFRHDGGGGRGSVHAGLPGQPRRHAGMGVVPVRWETDLFRPGGVRRCKTE